VNEKEIKKEFELLQIEEKNKKLFYGDKNIKNQHKLLTESK
jgi:hypothetical protein